MQLLSLQLINDGQWTMGIVNDLHTLEGLVQTLCISGTGFALESERIESEHSGSD